MPDPEESEPEDEHEETVDPDEPVNLERPEEPGDPDGQPA
jgi:hypothetical protein